MVVSVDGELQWMYRSEAFWLPLTERGQELNGDTLAAAAFRFKRGMPKPEEVDPSAWLDRAWEVRGTLLESTHFIPALNQAVSLLWVTETDEREDDDE